MGNRHAVLSLSTLLSLVLCFPLSAQKNQQQPGQQPSNLQQSVPAPTLRVTSSLVFLDVTVLDKKGHPVVTGLTKDDFTITEDKKPQRIFSFEPPEVHTINARSSDGNPEGKAPVTILVLDLLDSSFEDFAYIRYSTRKFLLAQPEQLTSPAEMLVVGNQSLDMLQGYTRTRADLLYALDHLPAALPYKHMSGSFFWERFAQSIDALQQIALQNRGIPGRKNIIWIGHGGPNLYLETIAFPATMAEKLREYVHLTTNMLVDSRISLFVIYPGLSVGEVGFSLSAEQAQMIIGDNDPFSGDINFGLFSNETGGRLFYNRNDVDAEIKRSEQLGAIYYTLTYQPDYVDPDGKFRRVRVSLRDPSLHAVTKAGYYAPDAKAIINVQQQQMIKLADAIHAAIPFNSLSLSLGNVVRHPDSRTAEFTVFLHSINLDFLPTEDGKDSVPLVIAAASLSNDRNVLASRVQHTTLTTASQDLTRLPIVASHFQLVVPFPKRTRTIRIAIEDQNGGRIGTAELDRTLIDAAPEAPTPAPQLMPTTPLPAAAQNQN
ncbi:MAG: VWA domain-containing protein [Terracidiphilus sp.]